MKSWAILALWIGASVVVVVGLGIGAVYLIDIETGRGRWAATTDVVVPAVAGFGALIVAVASWQTALRATKIASDAADHEAMRLSEDRRERYEWRLDEALVHIAKLLAAYRLVLARIQKAEMAGKPTQKLRAQSKDDAFELGSELGIVAMVAKGEDSEVIDLLQSALRKAATHPDVQHMKLVMAISAILQTWRSGDVKDLASTKKPLESIIGGGIMAD